MKSFFRNIITGLLARCVRRLRKKHPFKVVVVAGSIGKTSTKFAIAQLLGSKFRVQFQEGNYNVPLTAPLVFFGLSMPSLMNPIAWAAVFIKIGIKLLRPYPYDIVIVEVGTDGPGQLIEFGTIMHADIGVLTAISPEHMEFFGTIDEVAKEELVLSELCDTMLMNYDFVDPKYVPQRLNMYGYGITAEVEYKVVSMQKGDGGFHFALNKSGQKFIETTHPSFAVTQLYSICAAVAVADQLGMSAEEIQNGVSRITAVNGRMQLLLGINGSTIIDESYNASPEAMKAALQALYEMSGSQKIALLGNMNELGDYSAAAHSKIGSLCDPEKLSAVITLGPDANQYLAEAAEKQGCRVERCDTPYEAADYIKSIIQDGAVILVKGSQNKVFAEETIKQLLANPKDSVKLIRQSNYWMRRKAKSFHV